MRSVLTAFAASPDQGRGLARDFRVRWTLEELGQSCSIRLLGLGELRCPSHRRLHPFGQIPTWQDDGIDLFESGAIVLHLAQEHEGLLPADTRGRARALVWVFAALDTIEPPIWDWDLARMVEGQQPWHTERQPMLEARINQRLEELSAWLGGNEWLEGDFTLGDLMMVTVLRRLHGSAILDAYPTILRYVVRGEERPAFKRALAAQRADFAASSLAAERNGEAT